MTDGTGVATVVSTLEGIERARAAGASRQRALNNLATAGRYQALALKRQGWALARLPYQRILDGVTQEPEVPVFDTECAGCTAAARQLARYKRQEQAHEAVKTLSKAVMQTAGAVDSTLRLQELLQGMPDARHETTQISIQAWLALLTDEQFRLFEGWVRAAEGRSQRVLQGATG